MLKVPSVLFILVAVATGCQKRDERIEPIVDRGVLGGCPRGYVDHPADPHRCVLPVVAQRAMQRRPPQPWADAAPAPSEIDRINAALARERQVRDDARVEAEERRREAERNAPLPR